MLKVLLNGFTYVRLYFYFDVNMFDVYYIILGHFLTRRYCFVPCLGSNSPLHSHHSCPSTLVYTVKYTKQQYAPSWVANCQYTHKEDTRRNHFSEATSVYVHCSSACLYSSAEPIHGQWSPLYYSTTFFV